MNVQFAISENMVKLCVILLDFFRSKYIYSHNFRPLWEEVDRRKIVSKGQV